MKARHKVPLLTATRKLGHNIFFYGGKIQILEGSDIQVCFVLFSVSATEHHIVFEIQYSIIVRWITVYFFAVLIPVSIKDRPRTVDHGLRRTGHKTRTRYKTRTTDFVYKNSFRNVKLRETEIGLP